MGAKIDRQISSALATRLLSGETEQDVKYMRIANPVRNAVQRKLAFDIHRNILIKNQLRLVLAQPNLVQPPAVQERKINMLW